MMQEPQHNPIPPDDRATRFFRFRYTSSTALALGILLFFLPFVQVKCGTSILAENSGYGIAVGRPWKLGSMGEAFAMMGKEKNPLNKDKALKDKPNVFALLALSVALAGLVISFFRFTYRSVTTMSAALFSFFMLLALMIQYRIQLKNALAGDGVDGAAAGSFLKVNFTAWYYAALLVWAAAAFFAYKHHRIEMADAIARAYDFEFEREAAEPETPPQTG